MKAPNECSTPLSREETMLRTKEKMQSVLTALTLLAAVILIPCTLFGQRFTGEVTDRSGAVVPKATVTVHNQETNVATMTKATSAGTYAVPLSHAGVVYGECRGSGIQESGQDRYHARSRQDRRYRFETRCRHYER